jgi:hypothetical protein
VLSYAGSAVGESQLCQFILGTGFRADEVGHAWRN